MSDGDANNGPGVLVEFALSALISGATAWAVLMYAAARGVEKAAGLAAGVLRKR